MMKKTTVSVSYETRDRLRDIGRKGVTFDEIINTLIDFYIQNKPLK